MSSKIRICAIALLLHVMWFVPAGVGAPKGLDQEGNPGIKSAGPLCFGPEGVLFVGDPQSAAIYALDTGEQGDSASRTPVNVPQIDARLAALLGSSADQILIHDLAVHPGTGTIYLSLSRGKGNDAQPVIARVDGSGGVSELDLDKLAYAKVSLANAPDAAAKDRRGRSLRQESITDLAYFDGKLFVAGLSNEEFASKLRAVAYPFDKVDGGTSVEVYHGAHGEFETRSPVRTFAPFNINGEPHLLAAYTCTPLVKFPVAQLSPGAKITGTTVAELGNGNQPLDMVVYDKDGKSWLLMANSRHGVLKVSTENIERQEGITEPVKGGGTAGQSFEKVDALQNVLHLDKSGKDHAVLLVKSAKGFDLQTVALP